MKKYLVWAGLALLLILLGGACFSLYERVTVVEEHGFRGRAAYDPFYAAELLFEELGVEMDRPGSWRDLPPPAHTLLLLNHSAGAALPAVRLHEWVRQGGHLVVAGDLGFHEWSALAGGEHEEEAEEAEEEEDGDEAADSQDDEAGEEDTLDADEVDFADPLLEPLGLAILPLAAAEGAADQTLEMDRGTWSVHIGRRVGLSLDREVLRQEPRSTEGEDLTFSLVRVTLGKGWVTAVSDASFLTNSKIGDLDHAAFAWDVVAPPGRPPGGLSLYYRSGYPSWVELLREHGWKALLSGGIALLLFLWSRGSRFGPLTGAEVPERRSLLEHVAATGHFLWRNRLGEILLQSSRATLLRDAARLDPVLARLPEKEKLRHLAAKAGMSGGQLAAALEERSVEDPAEFTRIMTTLESVRRATGGRGSNET